jgi:YaiO family outer membrane protein
MGKNRKKRLLTLIPNWFRFSPYSVMLFIIFLSLVLSLFGQETAILEKARSALKNRNYEEVIHLCQPYFNQHPEDADIAFILAQAQAFSGNYQQALQLCKQILSRRPEHYDALMLQARIFIWMKDYNSARYLLEKLINVEGYKAEAYLELGRLEEFSGDLEGAEKSYQSLIKLNTSSDQKAEGWFRLSRIYLKKDNQEEAKRCLQQAIQLEPQNQNFKKELNLLSQKTSKGEISGAQRAEIWVQYRSDDYSDQPNAFSSERLFFLYRPTSRLTLIPKVAHTRYFNSTDYQFGLEMYPKLWKNSYAYLDLNYATPANSLPRTSWLLEIYQHIYRGLEGSLGYWHMHFRTADVSVYLGSLGYYFRDYYFYLRGYYTPEEAGKNFSWVAQGRRYFGLENYFYLSFGFGSRPFEISNLGDLVFIKSTLFGAGFNFYLQTHWKLEAHFSLIKEKDGPRRTTISLTSGYRF